MNIHDLETKIATLQRRRAELLSASKAADRKTRTRALIVLGGVIAAEAKTNVQAVSFLLARAANLQPRDREILAAAFPHIFHAATPAAPTSQESKNA